MNPLSISESILRNLDARRRRLQGQEPASGEVALPEAGDPGALISTCKSGLEKAIRESIRASFSKWEGKLVPEIEGIARRATQGWCPEGWEPYPPPEQSVEPQALRSPPPPPIPAPRLSTTGGNPQGSGTPKKDSWNELVDAVKELRREWDQETFEKCFGEEAPSGGAEHRGKETGGQEIPQQVSRPAETPSPVDDPPQEELKRKLDELIQLVKSSSRERGTGKAPTLSSEVTREIAREVASRLRDTLDGLKAKPEKGSSASPSAAPVQRIPIGDIEAMIDQITGSKRP